MISANDFISTYNLLTKPLLVEAYVQKNMQYLTQEDRIMVSRAISMFNKKLCYGKNKELKLLIPSGYYCFGDLYKGRILYNREDLRVSLPSVPRSLRKNYLSEYYPYGKIKLDPYSNTTVTHRYIFKEKYYITKYIIKNKFAHSFDSIYYSPQDYLGRAFVHNEEFFLDNVSFIQEGSMLPLRVTFRKSCRDMVGQFIKIMDADLFYRLVPNENVVEVFTSMEDATRA